MIRPAVLSPMSSNGYRARFAPSRRLLSVVAYRGIRRRLSHGREDVTGPVALTLGPAARWGFADRCEEFGALPGATLRR